MLKVVQEEQESNENGAGSVGASVLDELVRDAARQMLAVALQAEVATYLEAHVGEVDEAGHRLVVRNGFRVERDVTTAAGPVTIKAPRVNDKRIDGSPVSVTGSPRRSCRRGPGSLRGSLRCCRCCTCTGCRATTLRRR